MRSNEFLLSDFEINAVNDLYTAVGLNDFIELDARHVFSKIILGNCV